MKFLATRPTYFVLKGSPDRCLVSLVPDATPVCSMTPTPVSPPASSSEGRLKGRDRMEQLARECDSQPATANFPEATASKLQPPALETGDLPAAALPVVRAPSPHFGMDEEIPAPPRKKGLNKIQRKTD